MAEKSLWKQLGTNLLINVVTRALCFYSLYFLCALKKSTLLELHLAGVPAITQGLINLMKHKSTKVSQGEERNLGIMYY